jgi:transcriptional regulator with XRE-family HTH domain
MSQHTYINRPEKDRFFLTVGTRISATREAAGLSTRALAETAKLSLSTVQNAENGDACSLLVLAKLAEALDCTLDDLVPTEATR